MKMNLEILPLAQSPLTTDFGVVMALDAFDRSTVANMTALLTRDPKDSTQLNASIRFSPATREHRILLINTLIEEINKPEFDDLWDRDGEEEFNEEEDE